MVAATADRLLGYGEKIRDGRMNLSRWQTLSAKEIKNLHVASFTIATGGKSELGFTGLARLGDVVHFQLEHLRDFATSMPAVDDRDNRIPARLASYAAAAVGTYENECLDRSIRFGLSIARRVTAHGVESCEFCLDQEDIGWQDINEIPRIGDSPCQARCNCAIEFEKVTPS